MSEMFMPIGEDAMELLSTYSDAQRGRLISAMYAFFFTGELPVFAGAERHAWPALQRMLERMRTSYEAKREAGIKGGNARSQAVKEAAKEAARKPASAPAKAPVQANAGARQASSRQTKTDANTNTNTDTDTNTDPQINAIPSSSMDHCSRDQRTMEQSVTSHAPAPHTPVAPASLPPSRREVAQHFASLRIPASWEGFYEAMLACAWRPFGQPMDRWEDAVDPWLRHEFPVPVPSPDDIPF